MRNNESHWSGLTSKPQGLADFWLLLLKAVGPAEGGGSVGMDVSI